MSSQPTFIIKAGVRSVGLEKKLSQGSVTNPTRRISIMPRPAKKVDPTTLGGLLRQARGSRSLAEIASLMGETAEKGLSISLISQYERNKLIPPSDKLARLARILGIPADALQRVRAVVIAEETVPQLQAGIQQAYLYLKSNQPQQALQLLPEADIAAYPRTIKWQYMLVQGIAHFMLNRRMLAFASLYYASSESPEIFPDQQAPLIVALWALMTRIAIRSDIDEARRDMEQVVSYRRPRLPYEQVVEIHKLELLLALRLKQQQQALGYAQNLLGMFAGIGGNGQQEIITQIILQVQQEQFDSAYQLADRLPFNIVCFL